MKWMTLTAALIVCSASFSSAEAGGLFGCFHKKSCCQTQCCEPVCCEPAPVCCEPAPVCCEPAPTCCESSCNHGCGKKGCGLFGGLFGCCKKKSCCETSCCEPAPVCCEPAPVCCEPAPVCCEPAPCCEQSCGCNHGCKKGCFLSKLFSCCKKKNNCCQPACDSCCGGYAAPACSTCGH